jgi:ectoine hydroxylase-related dioxygenase (phytanoyl-CoA dioxygenase family)
MSITEEIVEGKGYVLIPEVLSATQVETARSLVLELAEKEKRSKTLWMEGKRERVFGLVYKGEIFELMVQHPTVLNVLEEILGEDAILSTFSAHILNPGAEPQGIHVEYPYISMKPPYPASPVMEMQVIWYVQDFTEDNGSPLFAPYSQKLCSPPDPLHFSEVAKKVTGKAGSVLISHGLCWHDSSVNYSQQQRVAIVGQYVPKFIRPKDERLHKVQPEVLDGASPKLKQLLGYDFKSAVSKDMGQLIGRQVRSVG